MFGNGRRLPKISVDGECGVFSRLTIFTNMCNISVTWKRNPGLLQIYDVLFRTKQNDHCQFLGGGQTDKQALKKEPKFCGPVEFFLAVDRVVAGVWLLERGLQTSDNRTAMIVRSCPVKRCRAFEPKISPKIGRIHSDMKRKSWFVSTVVVDEGREVRPRCRGRRSWVSSSSSWIPCLTERIVEWFTCVVVYTCLHDDPGSPWSWNAVSPVKLTVPRELCRCSSSSKFSSSNDSTCLCHALKFQVPTYHPRVPFPRRWRSGTIVEIKRPRVLLLDDTTARRSNRPWTAEDFVLIIIIIFFSNDFQYLRANPPVRKITTRRVSRRHLINCRDFSSTFSHAWLPIFPLSPSKRREFNRSQKTFKRFQKINSGLSSTSSTRRVAVTRREISYHLVKCVICVNSWFLTWLSVSDRCPWLVGWHTAFERSQVRVQKLRCDERRWSTIRLICFSRKWTFWLATKEDTENVENLERLFLFRSRGDAVERGTQWSS